MSVVALDSMSLCRGMFQYCIPLSGGVGRGGQNILPLLTCSPTYHSCFFRLPPFLALHLGCTIQHHLTFLLLGLSISVSFASHLLYSPELPFFPGEATCWKHLEAMCGDLSQVHLLKDTAVIRFCSVGSIWAIVTGPSFWRKGISIQ